MCLICIYVLHVKGTHQHILCVRTRTIYICLSNIYIYIFIYIRHIYIYICKTYLYKRHVLIGVSVQYAPKKKKMWIQRVPWKMRLEMVIGMQIEILNGHIYTYLNGIKRLPCYGSFQFSSERRHRAIVS